VIVWYAAGAVVAVWVVFQSTGLDFRAVALGGLVPLVDVVVGHQAVAHTLLAPTVAMIVVMGATAGRGRRLLRRRIIGVPIGWYFGIALSGAFTHQAVFWWPAFGADLGDAGIWPPLGWAVALELAGWVALRWIWVRCELADPARRADFVRTGRLVVS
jgi:hypothetical protein